jgi:tRNA modification GTPase
MRKAALERLDGSLSRTVTSIRAPILDLLALLEARLDHPDEDIVPIKDATVIQMLENISKPLTSLLAAFDRGRRERDGLRVCLIGRPNAGKSSLLNALLGRNRAIVSPDPGTTRDTLEETAILDGVATTLIDTAGLRRDATDTAEIEGVARAESALSTCDVAVLVVDGTQQDNRLDADLKNQALRLTANESRPVVVAVNKADLMEDQNNHSGDLVVSAKTGLGLEELVRAISKVAGGVNNDQGESLMLGARDRDAIQMTSDELQLAVKTIGEFPGMWEDRVASHLREAHARLGQILGEGAPDEVLHAVFSRFCVGK